jgi:hypothetical protein
MVGIKIAQTEGPARTAASYVPQGRHLDLPPQLDWKDDFRELADCMLVIGNHMIKCHSQVGEVTSRRLLSEPLLFLP